MKLALCLEYPIGLRGGVSVLVETLLEELVRRRHEVVLVSPDSLETLSRMEAGKLMAKHFYWNSDKIAIASSKKLAHEIFSEKVELAHFHFGGNFGFGNRFPFRCPVYHLARLGVPCLTTAHMAVGLLEGYCGPQKPIWFKAAMLPLVWCGKMQQLRHTRREIAVSRRNLEQFRRWYWPLRHRFTQIYHSRLREEPEESERPKREPVILNVGHLAWRKGQMVLAEAFARIAARHPDWSLQLAGQDIDHETERQILQLARDRRLDGRIQLLGERTDAAVLMRRAGIYVQPSFWEGLPLALQEALYRGCPAIASRIGAHEELIRDGETGLLFDPGNVAQLAHALEQLIRNAAQREHFGRAAAASVREQGMTAEQMFQRHLELYETARQTIPGLPPATPGVSSRR